MVRKGRILRYSFVGIWALFLGLVLVIGISGLSESSDLEALKEGNDLDTESAERQFEAASCLLSIFGSLIFLAIPAVMAVLIAFLVKMRYDAVFKKERRRRPRALSPVEEDYRRALEFQRFHNGNTYNHSHLEPPEGFARRKQGRIEIWESPDEFIRNGTITHIHGDANKFIEMVSQRGTGVPLKCPNCGGPSSRKGDNVVCDYCGSYLDFELIRNGMLRILS